MPHETPSSGYGSAGADDPSRSPVRALFCKEGEYWTVALAGNAVRLKHSRGLAYISYLLHHPGEEFHVLDLVGGIAGGTDETESDRLELGREKLATAGIHIGNLGDAGELLDDQAKRAYRNRLSELREELEEAKALGKSETAEHLEEEIAVLTGELSRAVGLRGRSRRAASASERARQTVGKVIRAAVERIAQNDTRLGEILSRSIKTGVFCSYRPTRESPIAWEFAPSTQTQPPPASGEESLPANRVLADSSRAKPSVLPFATFLFSRAETTSFVGREKESQVIKAAIDHGRGGRGSLVMLGGGPGMGKTRLSIEMAKYAAGTGFTCFLGRCYERDEALPYLPFVQIFEQMLIRAPSRDEFRRQIGENAPELAQLVPSLRRIFKDIPEPIGMPDQQKRRYIFQSLAEMLERAAQTSPQLLILDDLQWADESTLALLTHLVNGIGQLPMVIIGIYRDEYSDANPALARTLEELIRQGLRPLKLGGLSKDSVAEILGGMSQRQFPEPLVSAIYEETNGNPFFLTELYRHLIEEGRIFDSSGQFQSDLKIDEIDVPDNVRLVIARRLERFSDLEIRALSAAAVFGQSFSFQLLAAVSQMEIDELFNVIDRAQRLGVIIPSSEGPERPFTFAHELVRQTLLANTSSVRRQQLHAKAGAEIDRLYGAEVKEHAAEIADHLLKAGAFADRDALVRWLKVAGEAALEAAAFEEARAHFESALSRVKTNDSRQRAELLDNIGTAYRGLGRWQDAQRCWDEALNLFGGLNDQERLGRTLVAFAQGAHWAGEWRQAIEIAERGLARLSGVSRDRALLFANLGVGGTREGDYGAAEEAFNTALELAEQLSDNDLKGTVLAFRSHLNFSFLRLRETIEDARNSGELTSAVRMWVHAERLFWQQCALYHLGHLQEASRIAKQLEPIAARIGHVVIRSLTHLNMLWAAFAKQPDLAALQETLRTELDAQKKAGLQRLVLMLLEQLSVAEFLHGKWDEAMEHAEAAARTQALDRKPVTAGILVRLKAYAGDRDGAVAAFEEHRNMLPQAGQANGYNSWIMPLLAVEGLFVLGERETAATLYPLLHELIATGTVGMVFTSRLAQTAAGLGATAARNWDAAEEHFRIALEQAESLPDQVEQAEIRRFHAMMLLDRAARDDLKSARALLIEALERYTHIGMRTHVELTKAFVSQTDAQT